MRPHASFTAGCVGIWRNARLHRKKLPSALTPITSRHCSVLVWVSRWGQRKREEGEPRPKALGGDRRSGRIEAHHDAVLAALGPARDATIEDVRLTLARQGLAFGFGTIQRLFVRHGITRRKRPPMPLNRTVPAS